MKYSVKCVGCEAKKCNWLRHLGTRKHRDGIEHGGGRRDMGGQGAKVEVELMMPYHYYYITLFKKKQALKGPIFSTPSFHLLEWSEWSSEDLLLRCTHLAGQQSGMVSTDHLRKTSGVHCDITAWHSSNRQSFLAGCKFSEPRLGFCDMLREL